MDQAHFEHTIRSLILGSVDLIIYGYRSWGCSTLAKRLLAETIGQNRYVSINATLVSDRNAFYFLLNLELDRIISSFDPDSQLLYKLREKLKSEGEYSQTHDQWAKMMSSWEEENPALFHKMGRLYVLIENTEELMLNPSIIQMFYLICKEFQTKLRISFMFLGSNIKSKSLRVQDPFKRMMTFFMPRPPLTDLIQNTVSNSYHWDLTVPEQKRLREALITHLVLRLQLLEADFDRIKDISRSLCQKCVASVQPDFKLVVEFIRKGEIDILFKKLVEDGPRRPEVDEDNQGERIQKKGMHAQKYLNLIMTSLFLANGYSENEDRRRFMEYKRNKARRLKTQGVANSNNGFRKNDGTNRHNLQRIVAISQILEQFGEGVLKESLLQHHTLDYYGCFEYLKEEGKLQCYGKKDKSFLGKVIGDIKQQDARYFLRSIGLKMSQFTDSED